MLSNRIKKNSDFVPNASALEKNFLGIIEKDTIFHDSELWGYLILGACAVDFYDFPERCTLSEESSKSYTENARKGEFYES